MTIQTIKKIKETVVALNFTLFILTAIRYIVLGRVDAMIPSFCLMFCFAVGATPWLKE